MRILIDVTSAASGPLNTGIQRVVRGLTTELRREHEVFALVWDDELEGYRRLLSIEEQWLADPNTRPFPRLPGFLGSTVRRWRDRREAPARRERLGPLVEWLEMADLFVVPEIFRDGRLGVLEQAGRHRGNRKWIGFFYDATPLKLAEVSDPGRRMAIDAYHRALSTFDLVVVASRETEEDIDRLWRELGVPGGATRLLPWPIPFPLPAPGGVANFSARRLLYVATLEGRKNHLTLLAAAERLWADGQRFTLELIGRATRHWGPKVIPVIRRLQRQGRSLIWRGSVGDEALREAYGACSATVFPSLMEGYGIPILESLYFGRPCLCSEDGAIGEVSAGGGCLHADIRDPGALADGMARLLNDEALYHRLQAETERRTFPNWPDFVQQLLTDPVIG